MSRLDTLRARAQALGVAKTKPSKPKRPRKPRTPKPPPEPVLLVDDPPNPEPSPRPRELPTGTTFKPPSVSSRPANDQLPGLQHLICSCCGAQLPCGGRNIKCIQLSAAARNFIKYARRAHR